VGNVRGEDHRPPALGVPMPMGDDVADQFGLVHALGELAFDVIACLGTDAPEIGRGWRIDDGRHKILAVDQFGDLWALDQYLKQIAEPAAVLSAWRGAQPDHDGVGVLRQHPPIGVGGRVVGLIDDDQIGLGQLDRGSSVSLAVNVCTDATWTGSCRRSGNPA